MNILITGADGFIGEALTRHLAERYPVFPLVFRKREKRLDNEIVGDLTERDEVLSYFGAFSKKNKIDTIIHLASGMASPDNNGLDLLNYNLNITAGLVELIKLLKPKKVINFSSIAVYSRKNGVYDEEGAIRPSENTDCFYGLSKFCGENMLDFMLKGTSVSIIHLRIAHVYGAGMCSDRTIPVMRKELEEKNTITVYGDGERISNFIELSKLLLIVEFFVKAGTSGVYNIGDKNIMYLDLAKDLIKKYGNDDSKVLKIPNGSRAKFRLGMRKFRKLYGRYKNNNLKKGAK